MTLAKRAKLAKEDQTRRSLAETQRGRGKRGRRSFSLLISASPRLYESISSGSYLGELGALGEIIFSGRQCAHAVVTE
jgi:hypothetical protein